MRQVPQKLRHALEENLNSSSSAILLIGSGRLAKHLQNYFELEKILFLAWSRASSSNEDLQQKIAQSTHILLAISDSALIEVCKKHEFVGKKLVHFSGALFVPGVPSAHPLMSFSNQLYDLETYRSIHFVLEQGAPPLSELIPGLKNEFSYLENEKRAQYHALCSMSGNFSVILWEYFFKKLSSDLNLSPRIALPFMKQIEKNLEAALGKTSVMTGPLVRGDFQTIDLHLKALGSDPMAKVYQAFVEAYQQTKDVL